MTKQEGLRIARTKVLDIIKEYYLDEPLYHNNSKKRVMARLAKMYDNNPSIYNQGELRNFVNEVMGEGYFTNTMDFTCPHDKSLSFGLGQTKVVVCKICKEVL